MSCGTEKKKAVDLHQGVLQKNLSPERYLKIQLYVGAALNFDLLEHSDVSNVAVLKVSKDDLVKLWSSLTLQGFYKNHRCAFRVLQVLDWAWTRTKPGLKQD
uniref:Uncharacterized protein n=1 Tax=Periophthalmus magnuspinnatus TaxID=409849 RepID=A0A3B3Z999_9GOBI